MSLQIYIDGKFHDKENARISVFDHTFLYGDGVFEGIRVYEGCIFRLSQHLERLFSSARYIMLQIPLTIEELTEAVAKTVRRNQIRNGYIRLVVSREITALAAEDPAARKIAARAAEHLAALAEAIRRRLGPLPVAGAGRVFSAPVIWDRFAELTGAVRPLAPATVGAALLAGQQQCAAGHQGAADRA